MKDYNYSVLKGKIKEKYDTQSNFAKALGMSEGTLTSRLNNTSCFTQEDIRKCIELLGIDYSEIGKYFFTH